MKTALFVLLCATAPLAACERNPHHAAAETRADYRLTATAPRPITPGTPTALTLELRGPDGARVQELAIAHDKRMHLIVVSADLGFFAHVHPTPHDDGRLAVEVDFPTPGPYVLFADFTPVGRERAVTRTAFVVEGREPAAVPLASVALPARTTVGDLEVTLSSTSALRAGADAMLGVEVREHGEVITDLRDYLGARGHAVVIDDGATEFLHAHPMSGPGAPTVDFHTRFPAPGRYKVWVELRPRGEPLRASFVVDVR